MCEICGQYFCYPSCPAYDGRSAELGKYLFRCAKCGERMFEADNYTIYNGKPFCDDCADKMSGR